MQPLIIAVIISLCVYALMHILVARFVRMEQDTSHMRDTLRQMKQEAATALASEDTLTRSIMRQHTQHFGPLSKIFFFLPGAHLLYPTIIKAGMQHKSDLFLMVCAGVFALLVYVTRNLEWYGVALAVLGTVSFGHLYLNRVIKKRRKALVEALPDVLEMIVRSVRAGYPLNTVVRIVADNMQPPISDEFKQVADEMEHGSTIIEALRRMARRVEEPDVLFFVVVLSVQQEVGGNLAEVLSNLAKLIRRRKNLKLKILALSAEGRATMWVLGSLPVFMGLVINYMTPGHLQPFFENNTGRMVFASAVALVAAGVFIVRRMVSIKV